MTPLYAGIGGVVRELTEMDAGINGVVTPLTEMWAGVNGVNRQIFSIIKMATWQKWDIKTMYRYTRSSRSITELYSPSGRWHYYKANPPSLSNKLFEQRPSNLTEIFTAVSSFSAPITDPITKGGYYCAYSTTKNLNLCKFVNLMEGDTLTEVGSYDYALPASRRSYYPHERTENVKGDNLIETVSDIEGTYPDNGIQGNYWYVKI